MSSVTLWCHIFSPALFKTFYTFKTQKQKQNQKKIRQSLLTCQQISAFLVKNILRKVAGKLSGTTHVI